MPGQQSRGLQARRHIGDKQLNRLEFGDGRAKLFTLQREFPRSVERAAGDSERLAGNPDPAAIERGERDIQALALGAQQAVRRHEDVVKEQLRRRRSRDAELVLKLGNLEALRLRVDDES